MGKRGATGAKAKPARDRRLAKAWLGLVALCLIAAGAGFATSTLVRLEAAAPDAGPTSPDAEVEAARAADSGAPLVCRTRLMTVPSGALAHHDEDLLGATPLEVERPCRDPWEVRISLAGYHPEAVTLEDTTGDALRPLVLRKLTP